MRIRTCHLALTAVVTMGITLPANAAITFLDHFNGQTAFTLSPADGDYAGGSGTASITGTLSTDTGFFGGIDQAFHAVNTTGATAQNYAKIDGPGNIQYTSGNSGGVTVGAWVKYAGDYYYSNVIVLGDTGADYLALSYGTAGTHKPRVIVYDPGHNSVTAVGSNAAVASDWIYLSASVDLTNKKVSLYAFDKSGVLKTSNIQNITNPADWDVQSLGQVQIGGSEHAQTTDLWIDEVSIDNRALSGTEIQARVNAMVGGQPLSVPEPTGLSLLAVGGMLALRRRRA